MADSSEMRAMRRILLEDRFGITPTRYALCGLGDLSEEQQADYRHCMSLLERGVPVQHVVGSALFCGHRFKVTRDTLIPRPETEDLVQWVTDDSKGNERILDIGTGSGCIAISLALAMPQTDVTALDISAAALDVAKENSLALEAANVRFIQHDILQTLACTRPFDVIVSNPPYICNSERACMEKNVLDHEPHLALFVPDDDPLLFYRAIARRVAGDKLLRPGGRLYFELNSAYAQQTCDMLLECGFCDVSLRADRYGRTRMSRAVWQ